MKICIIAPIDEKIPPKLYGGIGRVISLLTEGLVNKGHDITLLAPENTKTSARLIPIIKNPLEANNPENNNDPEVREVFFKEELLTFARTHFERSS
jgi:glycosyltransferase involved in cell wall biosynthesis